MHPHELFRQVREWFVRPVQVRTRAYIVPPVLSASYVCPETPLGVPRRLGIASAISSPLPPRAWRGVLLWALSRLRLARGVSFVDCWVAT